MKQRSNTSLWDVYKYLKYKFFCQSCTRNDTCQFSVMLNDKTDHLMEPVEDKKEDETINTCLRWF